MKEEMQNDVDVEQLLREKSWDELSDTERESAKEAMGDRVEYERVRGMMIELRSGAGIVEEELQPSKHVRENLLAAFDDEQRRRRVLWWNSLGFWLRDQLRLDIPVVRFAIAGVILVLGIFTVMKLTGNDAPEQTVADKQTPPAPVDNNVVPKLEDNVEPPGMNVQPLVFPWTYQPPTPNVPDEDDVIVVEEVNPPVKDSVIVPQTGNVVVATDTMTNTMIAGTFTDSVAVSPLTISFTNGTAATCFGAANGDATATGSVGVPSYNWTWLPTSIATSPTYAMNSNMATVYTVVPNCRSLANDSKVINAMFSMK